MKYGWAVAAFLIVAVTTALSSPVASATGFSSDHLMIDTVQLRGEASTGQSAVEMIQITNPGTQDVDITGWCVAYAASTSTSFSTKGCFVSSSEPWLHYLLTSLGSVQFVTAEYGALHPEILGTFVMSSGLGNTAGQVKLWDQTAQVIDHVGWGVGSLAETSPIITTSSTVALVRNSLIDTDDNAHDFTTLTTTPGVKPSSVVEVLDVCHNLDGVQVSVPEGFLLDADGSCAEPVVDLCLNLDGEQSTVPDGYVARRGDCYEKRIVVISELLANALGSDTGAEFIELYNPGDVEVDLSLYSLEVGTDFSDHFEFDAGTVLLPGEYRAFYNTQLHFTLVNTTSAARLNFFDDTVIDQVPAYTNPADGETWALLNTGWAYTDQPTPNAPNLTRLPSVIDVTDTTTASSGLTPCGPGRYRNPITNRCRNIESDASLLAACEGDEYRNPETNRCRKLTGTTTSLAACDEGEERNPATNRCRKVLAASSELTACKPGQERNPLTNRCRTAPTLSGNGQQVKKVSPNMTTNALVLTTGIGAVGYGLYEWRSEFGRLGRRIASLLWRK